MITNFLLTKISRITEYCLLKQDKNGTQQYKTCQRGQNNDKTREETEQDDRTKQNKIRREKHNSISSKTVCTVQPYEIMFWSVMVMGSSVLIIHARNYHMYIATNDLFR